jgi:hypothetical protein
MGLDSSNVDPAAAQHSNNRIDDTKFTRPIFYFFFGLLLSPRIVGLGGRECCVGLCFVLWSDEKGFVYGHKYEESYQI